MQIFNTLEDYEKWLEEFEFLRENTTLSSLAEAKLRYMRGNTRNQRDVDEYEYNNRFRVWEKMNEEQWKKDSSNISLRDYAYSVMVDRMKDIIRGK